MNTPHPYAEILRAIADGKEVQWKRPMDVGGWAYQSWDDTLEEILNESWSPECYRVKPDVVVINDIEVPAPLRELPAEGTEVFWADLTGIVGANRIGAVASSFLDRILQRGLLHLTQEAAEAHAEALISFTKQP